MAPRKQLSERAKELQKDESWMVQIKESKDWVEQLQLEVENPKREFLPVQRKYSMLTASIITPRKWQSYWAQRVQHPLTLS